jgi:Asp-tRNA(Asn)/Glu-tRNA(Gln) amidotransferase A subunit family amidase
MTEPESLYRLTASQAHAKFVDGTLTVEAYAKSLLSRVEARDSAVHAWAYLDPDLVLRRARQLDQIPPERRGPLHGVAIAVKDVILTKDMPTQYNSPIYEGNAPQVDAASIVTLRANGALIFGKFFVPDLHHAHQPEPTQLTPPRQNNHDRICRHDCRPTVQWTQDK